MSGSFPDAAPTPLGLDRMHPHYQRSKTLEQHRKVFVVTQSAFQTPKLLKFAKEPGQSWLESNACLKAKYGEIERIEVKLLQAPTPLGQLPARQPNAHHSIAVLHPAKI